MWIYIWIHFTSTHRENRKRGRKILFLDNMFLSKCIPHRFAYLCVCDCSKIDINTGLFLFFVNWWQQNTLKGIFQWNMNGVLPGFVLFFSQRERGSLIQFGKNNTRIPALMRMHKKCTLISMLLFLLMLYYYVNPSWDNVYY